MMRGLLLVTVCLGLACSGPVAPQTSQRPPALIVSIDSVAAPLGSVVEVPVRLAFTAGGQDRLLPIGGFNFRIRFDATALFYEGLSAQGDAISEWEYFTYRPRCEAFPPDCASRTIEIIGIRNLQDGLTPDPPQEFPEGVLTTFDFQLISDSSRVGTVSPIQFASYGCEYNIMTPTDESSRYYIADGEFENTDPGATIDTLGCIRRLQLEPVLGFISGGVAILAPTEPPDTTIRIITPGG